MTDIEKLKDLLIVCDEADDLMHLDYHEYYLTLKNAKVELINYIKRMMQDEPYFFKLYLPSENAEACKISREVNLELIYFPFGIFSINLWDKLLKDKDNPVYELIEFLDFETSSLRVLLSARDFPRTEYITTQTLTKYNILDVFGLHNYENVYTDATRYFEVSSSQES